MFSENTVQWQLSYCQRMPKHNKTYIIKRTIKLPIYCQRAFHCLNHLFIPNRTREFFFITSRDASEDNKSWRKGRQNKKLSLAEKLAKTAKRVIEPLIKLPIYCQRAFRRLNHWFIPNRTRENVFFIIRPNASEDKKTWRKESRKKKIWLPKK